MTEFTPWSGDFAQSKRQKDSPLERERAYDAFRMAAERRFEEYPGKIVKKPVPPFVFQILNFQPPSHKIKRIELIRKDPDTITEERHKNINLVITYINKIITYSHLPSGQIIKLRPMSDSISVLPETLEDDTFEEEKFKDQQFIQMAQRFFKGQEIEQKLGINDKPVSAQEAKRAIAFINGQVI